MSLISIKLAPKFIHGPQVHRYSLTTTVCLAISIFDWRLQIRTSHAWPSSLPHHFPSTTMSLVLSSKMCLFLLDLCNFKPWITKHTTQTCSLASDMKNLEIQQPSHHAHIGVPACQTTRHRHPTLCQSCSHASLSWWLHQWHHHHPVSFHT